MVEGVGGNIMCWFSLNNSEMVKPVTLEFWEHSVIFCQRLASNLVSLTCPDFWISGEYLVKENCHNSRTSDDIDMKPGPVTKLDKKNKATSKIFGDGIMSANCDVIVIFLIYGQMWSDLKPRFWIHSL